MLTENLKDCMYDIVMAFDDEDGLPESVYNATYSLISELVSESVANEFAHLIDATDGFFYANNPKTLKTFAGIYF